MKFGVVTELSTFLVITQVSSGSKKSHILIFSKYKYLLVKIAGLANVKSCVTVGPIHVNVWISLLQRLVVTVTAVSSTSKASWVVAMYTMNNHTYNAMRVCDSGTYTALYLSCLGAKNITQSLWETLVSLLKKCCCHKKCCGCMGCAAV